MKNGHGATEPGTRGGVPEAERQPGGSISDDGVHLGLDEPAWVYEAGHPHECGGRSDVGEILTMDGRGLAPAGDVGQHDAGSDDVLQARAYGDQRFGGHVQATSGLSANITVTDGLAIGTDRRCSRDDNVRPYAYRPGESNLWFER